jgi:hypothetical protein
MGQPLNYLCQNDLEKCPVEKKKHLADPVDHQDIENAADTLRSVNKIRNALQHSGASTELLTIFSKLGISYPPQWGNAWDRVRAVTIEALRIIREKVLRYAAESA